MYFSCTLNLFCSSWRIFRSRETDFVPSHSERTATPTVFQERVCSCSSHHLRMSELGSVSWSSSDHGRRGSTRQCSRSSWCAHRRRSASSSVPRSENPVEGNPFRRPEPIAHSHSLSRSSLSSPRHLRSLSPTVPEHNCGRLSLQDTWQDYNQDLSTRDYLSCVCTACEAR